MNLILGPGPGDFIPAQGPRRAFKLMAEEWNDPKSFGVLRIVRLILILTAFVFPQIYLDWILSRGKVTVDARIIGVWRDALNLLRLATWPMILMTGFWRNTVGVILVSYLMADITRNLLGGVLAWGRHSIDPTRSALWGLANYVELVLGFAGLLSTLRLLLQEAHRGNTRCLFQCRHRGNCRFRGYISNVHTRTRHCDRPNRTLLSVCSIRA